MRRSRYVGYILCAIIALALMTPPGRQGASASDPVARVYVPFVGSNAAPRPTPVPTASPTATQSPTATPTVIPSSTATRTESPTCTNMPTATCTPTATATPSPTAAITLVPIVIESYSPNEGSTLEQLVILRGDAHLFDPSAQVSGGSGALHFAWYDRPEGGSASLISAAMDPAPVQLAPGVHYIRLVIQDDAGQTASTGEIRVVKVGEPVIPQLRKGVELLPQHLTYDYTPEEIDVAIQRLVELNPDFVRVVFGWAWLEPERGGHIYWEDYTPVLQKVRDAGIQHIIGCVETTPMWANPLDEASPPSDIRVFLEFYSKFLQEYRGLVDIFEIWNEPNLCIHTSTPVQDYFELLKAGYLSVKFNVSPSTPVLLGGLHGSGDDAAHGYPGFFTELCQMGGAEYMDVVGIHPYVYPKQTNALEYVQSLTREAAQVMARFEIAAPLIISEIGWPTRCGPGQWWELPITEEEQANWLGSLDALFQSEGNLPMSWYRFNDPKNEVDFGLIRTDLSRRPAFIAFQELH